MRNICVLSILLFLLVGCATAPQGSELINDKDQLTSIQQVNADRLAKVKTGMSLDAFRGVIPEAYVAGQNQDVTAYELTRDAKYVTQADLNRQNFWWGVGSPRAKTEKQKLWFYFFAEKLVKWGQPWDWPQSPDKVIEVRRR